MHVKSRVVVAWNSGNDSWLFDGGFLTQDPNTIHIDLCFCFTDCSARCSRITQASVVAIPFLHLFIQSQESFGFDYK